MLISCTEPKNFLPEIACVNILVHDCIYDLPAIKVFPVVVASVDPVVLMALTVMV